MRVIFLGTGSAMPAGSRCQTGILVEEEDRQILIDCGSGILHRLGQTSAGYLGFSSILITHHHLDHIADLLPIMKARWLSGEEHLEIIGPSGTATLVEDLLDVHEYMQDRIALDVRDVSTDSFKVNGFNVRAFNTQHSMPGFAYRIDERFTFSGDSEASSALCTFADGSTVLAHDCSFPDDVDVSNHPTPSQLGAALAGSSIDRVYLTHLYPHTIGRHEEMRSSIAESYDGEVRFAEDGLRINIE